MDCIRDTTGLPPSATFHWLRADGPFAASYRRDAGCVGSRRSNSASAAAPWTEQTARWVEGNAGPAGKLFEPEQVAAAHSTIDSRSTGP